MTGLEKRARRWVLREMTRIEVRQALGASLADRPQLCRLEAIDRETREHRDTGLPVSRP